MGLMWILDEDAYFVVVTSGPERWTFVKSTFLKSGRPAQGPGPRAQGPRPRAQGPGPRAKGPGPRAKGLGPRAQGPGPKAQGPGPSAVDRASLEGFEEKRDDTMWHTDRFREHLSGLKAVRNGKVIQTEPAKPRKGIPIAFRDF